jgi:hypothetical protein
VFENITNLSKAQVESEYVQKYCIVAMQFWLHAMTKEQWESGKASEGWVFLLSGIVNKKQKVQRQATKSLCIILQGKGFEELSHPLGQLQEFVQETFEIV